MDLNEAQKRVWDNKVKKGFNTTNVFQEFCYLVGEVGEAIDAYMKKKDDLGSELADIGLYLLGVSQMLGFSLADEMEKKIKINEARVYKKQGDTWVKIEKK